MRMEKNVSDVQLRIKKEVREMLKKKKMYPRESHSDVIKRLIKKDMKEIKDYSY